jgi:hypothetical protein
MINENIKNLRLSSDDFNRLIGPARAGDAKALEELTIRTIGYASSIGAFVFHSVKNELNQQTAAFSEEDCRAIATMGLAKLVSKPIPEAISNTGQWLQAVKWKALGELEGLTKGVRVTSADAPSDLDAADDPLWTVIPNQSQELEETGTTIDIAALSKLITNRRHRRVFLAVASGLSPREIATLMGISRQRVAFMLARAIAQIRSELQKTKDFSPSLACRAT